MTKFKAGDRFIPYKQRVTKKDYLSWLEGMDKYNGSTLTVERVDELGDIQAKETCYYFQPHWCEKVEENSVNFVQRECDTISIEATLSTSTSATLGDVKKPFLIVTTNHHGGIKYEEGTAKSPYIPLIPLSPNHIPEVRKTIDWEQRKWEVVMQLAAARLSRINIGDHPSHCKTEVKFTIELADEMIKQLKGES